MALFLVIFIGALYAGCGVAYKIGSEGKVPSIESAVTLSFFGFILFGLMGYSEWSTMTPGLYLAGALFGLTQFLGCRLILNALKMGPLSPVWCAQSLSFVPVIIYSALFLGESFSSFQYISLVATFGAILAAAWGGGGKHVAGLRQHLVFGAVLVTILVSLSVLSLGLKFCSAHTEVGTTASISDLHGNALMALTYLFIGLCGFVDLTLRKAWVVNRQAVTSGALLTVCALSAFALTLSIVSKVPAVLLFAGSSAVSILGACLISTFCFREKRTTGWYLTLGMSLLAILFNR